MAFLQRLVPAAIKPGDLNTSASESADSDTDGGSLVKFNILLHRFLSGVTLEEKCGDVVIR